MNFSEALQLIKEGKRLTRNGWNGKEMFVYFVTGSEFETSLPPLNEFYEIVTYRPHIDLRAADGTCGVWSISNTDALAEDWEIFL